MFLPHTSAWCHVVPPTPPVCRSKNWRTNFGFRRSSSSAPLMSATADHPPTGHWTWFAAGCFATSLVAQRVAPRRWKWFTAAGAAAVAAHVWHTSGEPGEATSLVAEVVAAGDMGQTSRESELLAHAQRVEATVTRSTLRLPNSRLCAAYAAWMSVTAERKRTRTILSRAAGKRRRRRITRCLNQWMVFTDRFISAKAMWRRVLLRVCARRVGAALRTWKQVAAVPLVSELTQAQRVEAEVTRCVRRLINNRRGAAYGAWRVFATSMKQNRLIIGKAAAKRKRRSVAKCVRQWVDWTGSRIRARGLCRRILRRLRSWQLAIAWKTWEHAVVIRRTAEWSAGERATNSRTFARVRSKQSDAMARRSLVKIANRLLVGAFEAWGAATKGCRRNRLIVRRVTVKWQRRALTMSLDGWLGYVERRVWLRRLCSKTVLHMVYRHVAAGWNALRINALSPSHGMLQPNSKTLRVAKEMPLANNMHGAHEKKESAESKESNESKEDREEAGAEETSRQRVRCCRRMLRAAMTRRRHLFEHALSGWKAWTWHVREADHVRNLNNLWGRLEEEALHTSTLNDRWASRLGKVRTTGMLRTILLSWNSATVRQRHRRAQQECTCTRNHASTKLGTTGMKTGTVARRDSDAASPKDSERLRTVIGQWREHVSAPPAMATRTPRRTHQPSSEKAHSRGNNNGGGAAPVSDDGNDDNDDDDDCDSSSSGGGVPAEGDGGGRRRTTNTRARSAAQRERSTEKKTARRRRRVGVDSSESSEDEETQRRRREPRWMRRPVRERDSSDSSTCMSSDEDESKATENRGGRGRREDVRSTLNGTPPASRAGEGDDTPRRRAPPSAEMRRRMMLRGGDVWKWDRVNTLAMQRWRWQQSRADPDV